MQIAALNADVPAGISTFLSRVEFAADSEIAAMLQVLDEAERRRCESFRFRKDAMSYASAHFALRQILGDALGCKPKDVRFSTGEYGKPAIHAAHCSDLRFNLSHSGEMSLIVLATGVEVGADIERIRLFDGLNAIAEQYFGEKVARELSVLEPPECARAFSSLWVQFEALTKAKGTGITASDARLPVSSFPISFASDLPIVAEGWTITPLIVPDGYAAAIAFSQVSNENARRTFSHQRA